MAGWVRLHSPVYRRRSHLPPGTRGEENQGAQNRARAAQRRPHFPPGNNKARRQKKSAGPPGRASRWDATALLPGGECPDSSTICISPGEPENSWLESGAEVAGMDFGGPLERVPRRAPVSAQLANSGTFAKLPRAGEQPRSGPHHRGPRGGSGPLWVRRTRAERKEHREAAARAHGFRQQTLKRPRRDTQLGGAPGRRRRRSTPTPRRRRCGGARLPGRRAAEVPRSWSGAGAAAASLRGAAAAAGRTGGRAELGAARRGRRGAAGLTGPDEAEGEAASAGGGAGPGGPGPSAQRGALGAVP